MLHSFSTRYVTTLRVRGRGVLGGRADQTELQAAIGIKGVSTKTEGENLFVHVHSFKIRLCENPSYSFS